MAKTMVLGMPKFPPIPASLQKGDDDTAFKGPRPAPYPPWPRSRHAHLVKRPEIPSIYARLEVRRARPAASTHFSVKQDLFLLLSGTSVGVFRSRGGPSVLLAVGGRWPILQSLINFLATDDSRPMTRRTSAAVGAPWHQYGHSVR